jgi:hypothetical protein
MSFRVGDKVEWKGPLPSVVQTNVIKAIQDPAPVREFLEKNNQPMYGDWYRFVIESEGQD